MLVMLDVKSSNRFLPSKKVNSTTKEKPRISAPCDSINLAAATAVPPVANKSSCIITLSVRTHHRAFQFQQFHIRDHT